MCDYNEYCPTCGEPMTFEDDSFSHEFGIEKVVAWVCYNEKCDEHSSDDE